jgi:opacity protein-like surface antigen/outer membrane receptor protein involved in Fe transport
VALCVFAALNVPVSAQTPAPPATQPSPSPEAPVPGAPAAEAPAASPPNSTVPAATTNATALPTITVSAKPQAAPPKRNAAPQAATTSGPPPVAAPAPAPPSPYQTGAPNIAGGTPIVPQMASQMVITGAQLNSRPVSEPAEILEAAPGLAVVQHSGSGKANQYYLRGYNLDHGTDMATFWDDVPINLPTNAHGQGYTDLNFLIPETISSLEVRKGPYWADVGDFDNAGALNISLRDSIGQNIQAVTAGSFGYTRLLSYGSVKAGGGALLYAGEFNTENGPWDTAENLRKFSGLLRYSQGTATDGISATAMAYANSWNASDQIALRAITTGQVGLFGEIDPTDGGDTSRFMLSTRFAQSDDYGMWKANAYVVKYTLNLFNNFTWFTTNPTLGDQFHQSDDRVYAGGAVSRTFNGTLWGLPSQTVVGLQTRDDDINVGLTNTFHRQFLSNTLYDHVNEGNAAIYAQNTTRWTDWWRTTVGLRGDYFAASVNSMLQPANSGNPVAMIASPKFTSTFGPFYKTEFFVGAGLGYHSNDARGVTATEVAGDPTTPQSTTPFLVRTAGAEIGARTKIVPGLDSSISLFYLHQNSELVFEGDTGTTSPGPPSVRTGIEITNSFQPVSWFRLDADLALSRARFTAPDTAQQQLFDSLTGFPQAQIGNAPGNFIPEAPWMVASAGITLGERTGWFSALRWRYISARPLTEDGVFQSPPVNTINGRVGYQFANGWRVQLDALNLLNSSSYNASYAYGALLPSDALFAKCFPAGGAATVPAAVCQNGFMDYSVHPLDPTAVRLTIAGPLDAIDLPKMAAEFKRALPTYQPPAPDFDWTGFYVGAYVDNAWSHTGARTIDNVSGGSAGFKTDGSRWGGGVQIGFDYMMPSRLVLGVVADMSSGGTRTTTIADASGVSAEQTTVFDSETVRGKIGYAADNVLFYATGGFAWSNDQFVRTQLTGTVNGATAGTDEAVNKGLVGWTAGGGIAYAFAQNWNVFAEYRHTGFGSSNFSLPFSQLTTSATTSVSAVELGVNYKFTSGGQPSGVRPAPYSPGPEPSVLIAKSPSGFYAHDWTGLYLGSDGGFGWEAAKGTLTDVTGAPLSAYGYGVNGPLAGLFAGANYQWNRLVLGAEGDWQWSNLTGNNQILAPIGAAGAFPAGPFTIATTVKDFASIRGRLGFSFDRFLAFATAGWAWANPVMSYALVGGAPFVNQSGRSTGWSAGAGVDYAVSESIFARIEYRHTSVATAGFVSAATNAAEAANRVPIDDLRAGIAYKFGTPVAARF